MTAIETIRRYADDSIKIASALKESLALDTIGVISGSVARAQGPFGDIDVALIGTSFDSSSLAKAYFGVPAQYRLFDYDGFTASTKHGLPRGWLCALDSVVVNDRDGVVVHFLEQQKSTYVDTTEGQTEFMAMLATIHEVDTTAPDIIENSGYFAMKRQLGSKRSIMRSILMAAILLEAPFERGNPTQRYEHLHDAGILNENTLESMLAIQSLLPQWRKRNVYPSEWDEHLRVTSSWSHHIQVLVDEHVSNNSPQEYTTALQDCTKGDTEACAKQIQKAANGYWTQGYATSLFYRAAANPNAGTEVINTIWSICEANPTYGQDLASIVVQNNAFPTATTNPHSHLLQHPDIQFASRYTRKTHS